MKRIYKILDKKGNVISYEVASCEKEAMRSAEWYGYTDAYSCEISE